MYHRQVPRSADPAVRLALVERAAEMVARGEPVSLRNVAAAVGTSTMAVYTHFGGMPGLWLAVREEGFARLAQRLAAAGTSDDPLRDLVGTQSAYVDNAVANPDLYLAMFNTRIAENPPSAGETFGVFVAAVGRAVEADELAAGTDPAGAAVRLWAMTHGLVALTLTGALTAEALAEHLPAMSISALVGLGADPRAARAAVTGADGVGCSN